jgi:hypothetical protein
MMEVLISDTEFPPLAEVELLTREMEKAKSKQPNAKWAELDKLCVVSNPDYSFFSRDVLKALDADATATFKECATTIGVRDDTYRTQLKSYARAVHTTLDEVRNGHRLLEKVKAKLWWLLQRRGEQATPYPLVTQSVLRMLSNSFKEVGSAVHEVTVPSDSCLCCVMSNELHTVGGDMV